MDIIVVVKTGLKLSKYPILKKGSSSFSYLGVPQQCGVNWAMGAWEGVICQHTRASRSPKVPDLHLYESPSKA
jgi:hypothetical protein